MFTRKVLSVAVMLAALAAAGASQAANVNIYGRIDTGLIYHNYGKDSVKDDTFTMESGTNTATRIGMEGYEELTPDTKAIFRLESRFTSDNGQFNTFSAGHPSRMFGGQSTVGLVSKTYGELTFGRVAGIVSSTGPYDLEAYMDVYGGGTQGTGNAPVLSGRHDNMITYRTPWIAGIQGTFQYSLKSDSYDEGDESTSDTNRFFDAALHYNVGQLHVIAAYDQVIWGHKKQINNGSDTDKKVFTLGGSYRFEPATVYLQMQYFDGLNSLDGFTANTKDSSIKGYGIYAGTELWYGISAWKWMVYWRDYELEPQEGKSFDGNTLGITTKYVYRPSKTVDLYVGGGISQWDRISDGKIYTDQDINFFTGVTKYF